MKCKILSLLIIVVSLIAIEYKVNKIDIINTQTEKKLVDKYKPKKVDKVKKVKKKTKEEKELKYFSKLTGKKVVKVTKIDMKLSFYTSLDCENYEGCNGVTSSGVKLYDGVVANNYYPMETNLFIKGYGEYKILDRGGKGLDSWVNFDMYIPRNYGESDRNYYKRVNSMGIRSADGYILKFEEE